MGNLCAVREESGCGEVQILPPLGRIMGEAEEERLDDAKILELSREGEWSRIRVESLTRDLLWRGPLDASIEVGQSVDVMYTGEMKISRIRLSKK
jgi:hypothetical protein